MCVLTAHVVDVPFGAAIIEIMRETQFAVNTQFRQFSLIIKKNSNRIESNCIADRGSDDTIFSLMLANSFRTNNPFLKKKTFFPLSSAPVDTIPISVGIMRFEEHAK